MFLKHFFNSFFNSRTNTQNIINANFIGEKIIKEHVCINGKTRNSFFVDITNQPLIFKEIECEHFLKLSLSQFKFVFIQNESLTKTKVTIKAPQNLIEHIFVQNESIGFNGINSINVVGNSKNLNTNITIEGKLPDSIELYSRAILTTFSLKKEHLSIKTGTSALFNALEIITNDLNLESCTSSQIEVKHLKPISEKLNANIICSNSSILNVDYFYNSTAKVNLSTSSKFRVKKLINSQIKGNCSTSAQLIADNLNFVDVTTSTSGKIFRI